jgi:hypothetical protein
VGEGKRTMKGAIILYCLLEKSHIYHIHKILFPLKWEAMGRKKEKKEKENKNLSILTILLLKFYFLNLTYVI